MTLHQAARPTASSPAARRRNLKRLLAPRHIAFIGGANLAEPIRQARAFGFAGPIWVVNPQRDTIAGLSCFHSVEDLPEAPDAAFLAVPREPSIELVAALARRGAGGVIGYAAGFAEIGPEGAALQQRLAAAAGDLALVGPNCYGLVNALDGIALWPSGHGLRRVERGAAMVAQSGNLALNVTMNLRSVPFAHVISMGNQACLDLADYIAVLADDPRVTAIALYIEGVSDVAAFAAAADAAFARGIPLVALKAGASELGSRLAVTHTSSLAGDDALYDALFERLGILRVHSLPALLETVKLLSVAGTPARNRLAVFTCSGGDSLMVADAAAPLDIALPQPSPEQSAALRSLLPEFATVANPLDYNTSLWGDRAALIGCFSTMLAQGYDAAMLVLDYPHEGIAGRAECDISVDALLAAATAAHIPAMVASTLPELIPEPARARMVAAGIAPLQGLPEALTAVAHAMRFRQAREAAATRAVPRPHLAVPRALAGVPKLIDEAESKRRLAAFGVPVPPGRGCPPDAAAATATSIGFPVVIKVLHPLLAHKSEVGAVALNVGSAAAATAAVARLEARLAATGQGGLEQVLVEPMIADGVAELLVGVVRDERLGLALVIGAGGLLVDLLGDCQRILLPTDEEEIRSRLLRLRTARLLTGFRGRAEGDLDAAVRAIGAVATFAEAHGERLVELDVNPLIVRPKGLGAVAVDALIRMAEP